MTKKHKGFIQLSRDILNDDILKQNGSVVKVYLYLLLKINHSDVEKNGKTYKQNEHITTYERIQDDLHLGSESVSKALKYLAENGYIKIIEGTGRGTHIRVAADDEEKEKFKQEYQPKQKQNKKSSERTNREKQNFVVNNIITKTKEKSTENEELIEQFKQMSQEQRLGMFAFIFRRQVNNQLKQSEIIDYIKKASDETLVKMYQYLTSRPKHDIMTLDEFAQKALNIPD